MPSSHLTTSIKNGLNALLNPIGLEIRTTRKKRIEQERLRKLQSSGHWKNGRYDQGLVLEDEKWLAFLFETCRPFQADYTTFPLTPNGNEDEYFSANGWFDSVDAEVLYSVLRRSKPANVVEVGSGFSTRLMRRAIDEGKLTTKITSIDPHPNTSVQPYTDEYIRTAVEDVEAARILNLLSAGDILFIDSSHTVRTGGDVPYLLLEILPRLKPGVLIHIHDIFLPFDYPEQWVLEDWGWTEQYLVHAFLAFNQTFEILWPARYMWEHHRPEIGTVIANASFAARPSSLWIKKLR